MKLLNQLSTALSGVTNAKLKGSIGDSVTNNRVPTVSQVIRFLYQSRRRSDQLLAAKVEGVYEVLRNRIDGQRRNSRSDAVDINEFRRYLTWQK
ncbi:MAG TPA: hypothetical protein VIL57_03335 [Bacteroidia bacterium]